MLRRNDEGCRATQHPVFLRFRQYSQPVRFKREIMYGLNSLIMTSVLLISMSAALEAGYRIGRGCRSSTTDTVKSHVSAIQASLLGILALLIGFTFSLALQRFESRSEAVVNEANAIGTAYLRAQLLPVSVRSQALDLLHRYIDLRVQTGTMALDKDPVRQALLDKTNRVLDSAWALARQAAEEDSSPVTTGLFIQSLNDAIDSFGRRDAELSRHVPESIWLLLYCTFLITAGVIGYSAGISNHRPAMVTYIMILLIVMLAFIIIDLDRPRRGFIRVDQSSLTKLKSAVDMAQSVDSPQKNRP